jgi:hypothetical protein
MALIMAFNVAHFLAFRHPIACINGLAKNQAVHLESAFAGESIAHANNAILRSALAQRRGQG